MTLFAKAGLCPALICATIVSFATSTAFAGNLPPAQDGQGAKNHTKNTSSYKPRNRIKYHRRHKNRPVKGYIYGGRKVRVIDTAKSGYKAGQPSLGQLATSSNNFDRRYERLVLRYLRDSIDAAKYDQAKRRADDHLAGRYAGQITDSDVAPYGSYVAAPVSPTEGALTEVVNDGPLRPRAEITRVTEEQRIVGERRAAARARRFNREGGSTRFRFYRDNEAYDERYPSVVYLNSH